MFEKRAGPPREVSREKCRRRNAYQKVGMFGLKTGTTIPTSDAFLGDQIRGFGFTHDGAVPTIVNFMSITTEAGGFNQSPAIPGGFLPGTS